MVKCVFCGKDEHPSKGLHLIRNDGTVNYFCSSKCRKNHNLGRRPEKVNWIKKKDKKEAVEEKKE